MALALIPSYDLQVTYAAIDEESVIIKRSKTFEIVGANWAAAEANRDLFLADLILSTGAQIVEHRMTEKWGDNAAIVSTFNLYRELVISFVLDGAEGKKAAHTVIAPSLNFMSGQSLNLGHADVTAYINNFLATGGIVTISDGEFVKDANNVAASRARQVASGKSYT
jgi:hypothetical protein